MITLVVNATSSGGGLGMLSSRKRSDGRQDRKTPSGDVSRFCAAFLPHRLRQAGDPPTALCRARAGKHPNPLLRCLRHGPACLLRPGRCDRGVSGRRSGGLLPQHLGSMKSPVCFYSHVATDILTVESTTCPKHSGATSQRPRHASYKPQHRKNYTSWARLVWAHVMSISGYIPGVTPTLGKVGAGSERSVRPA